MTKLCFQVLFLSVLFSACADEPSPYAAATPAAAPPPAAGSSEADTRVAEAEARAAAAEAQLAQVQADQQAPASAPARQPSSSSNTSYTLPPGQGGSAQARDVSGIRRICHTYDRTSVARYRGMEVCYEVTMQQGSDGSLRGSGVKVSEQVAGQNARDLPPSEQSPIQLTGYIDSSEVIQLEYVVQGARRTSKGVASYNANPATVTDKYWFVGTFRTDAANASGTGRYSI